ncbi:AAA family ATPase [Pseudomonas putida]|uniref:AAA family ATPase n=1 Tax=Pseudomonas putida TaxID=303 RepID=UPI0022717861|nr:AAA family ATPase [Pseudomonas putida]WAB95956.1 AAA family ATPase [Pseudomonas putida]
MSNFPIKFLSVEISNFRGVPGVLKVPLDAPLTVIYAANGTGKSTICYALEWLLTNEIKDVNDDKLACQWGEGETYVSAKCLIDGVHHEMWRQTDNFWLSKEGGKRKKLTDEKLLTLLTPAAISGKTPQATKKAKRGWLRNSRWLYSNSLSLLIDNKHAEERQQIFADILGFGHLAGTLRDLKDYRGALPSTRGLHDNIFRLTTEIEETQLRLEGSAPSREKGLSNLRILKESFGLSSTQGNFVSDLREVDLRLRIFDQRTESRLKGLIELESQWDYFHSSQQQIEVLRRSVATVSEEVLALAEQQKNTSEELSLANIKYGDGERSVSWADSKLSILQNSRAITKLPSVADYFEADTVTHSSLSTSFVEFGWSKEKKGSWRDALDTLESRLPEISGLVREQSRMEANYVHPPGNLQAAIDADKLAQDDVIRQAARFETLADTSERLRSLGAELLNSSDSHVCPLCTHAWEDSGQLKSKVLSQKILSPTIREASLKLDAARTSAQATAQALAQAQSAQALHEQFVRQLNTVKGKLSAFDARTNYLTIMGVKDFSRLNIQQVEYLKERVLAAIELDLIFSELPDLEKLFSRPPILNFVERVEGAIIALEEYRSYYKKQMDDYSPERTRLDQAVKSLLAAIDERNSQNKFTASSISAMTTAVDRFITLWKDVVQGSIISPETRLAAVVEINSDREKVAEFKALYDECAAIAKIDVDASSLERLLAERKGYQEKLNVGSKYIIEADSAIEQYELHVKELTSASLGVLLSPATELFSRMHANEVYKGLGVTENQKYFQWTAFAEGHDEGLDAESKFSQGQRQDLALSLYLARARNTGGSFLLDEPIAHLDDLNRVAMLDIFRLVATSMPTMSVVLTTASESLARHMAQKFSSITDQHLLNMVRLEGNPRTGVTMSVDRNISGTKVPPALSVPRQTPTEGFGPAEN